MGYLLKDRVSDVAEFVDGVRRVAAGGTVLDPEVVAAIMARRRDEPLDRLTPREKEVMALMAEGRSNTAIAAALFVTEKAVAKHINSIFTKLDLPDRPRRQPPRPRRPRLAEALTHREVDVSPRAPGGRPRGRPSGRSRRGRPRRPPRT